VVCARSLGSALPRLLLCCVCLSAFPVASLLVASESALALFCGLSAERFVMAVRKLSFPLQTSPIKEDAVLVGHPCGFIATAGYLRSRPKKSRAVSSYLANDAFVGGLWNFASFASMLETMQREGCELSRYARRDVLGRWVRMGRPAPWLAVRNGLLTSTQANLLTAKDCVQFDFVETN
jgi:hypothetical protein